jgi:FKBP-type peptidyl-prolyl cis-trans isomerase
MAENKKEGAEFLKENAKREGVVTTASGLQYEVLEEGDGGTKPTLADSVTVHYVGKLLNGTEFDSSVARGEPATFKLRTVIPGWTEVLQLMSPGDKYRAVIPAHLAYGDRGAPPNIPPSAVLDFEVQLISVEVGGASKVNIKPPGL